MIKKIILATSLAALLASCAGTKQPHNFISANGAAMQLALEKKIGDRVLFKVNTSLLSDEAKSILDKQSEWLQENPKINIIFGRFSRNNRPSYFGSACRDLPMHANLKNAIFELRFQLLISYYIHRTYFP